MKRKVKVKVKKYRQHMPGYKKNRPLLPVFGNKYINNQSTEDEIRKTRFKSDFVNSKAECFKHNFSIKKKKKNYYKIDILIKNHFAFLHIHSFIHTYIVLYIQLEKSNSFGKFDISIFRRELVMNFWTSCCRQIPGQMREGCQILRWNIL